MKRLALLLLPALAVLFAGPVQAQTMIGVLGNGSSSPGWTMTINQTNGAGTLLADAVSPGGLTGVAVNSGLQMYGSTIAGFGSTSSLVLIDPYTGALMANVAAITSGGSGISIGDLAFQPGTGTLYGIRSNSDGMSLGGRLYTIDTTTGVATLVGNTGAGAGGGIAFATDGTLYQTSYNSNFDFTSLNVIDASDASRVSTIAIAGYFDGLAVRSDGTIFAAPGGSSNDGIYTINAGNGAITQIGNTGAGAVSDMDFFVPEVPEPGTLVLLGLGLAGAALGRRRRNS